jgi:hypothetical protein
MDSLKIKTLLWLIVALFGALYLGISAATAQFETVAWVLGGITLITCLALEKKIWLLLPFMMSMNLPLRIPSNPSTLLLAQVLVLGFSALLIATRRLDLRLRFSELELLILGLTVLIAQVYFRNPAGLWLFNTATVGGKAYFIYAISLATCLLLCSMTVKERDLRKIFPLMLAGSVISVGIGLLGKVIPIVGYLAGANYSYQDDNFGEVRDGRASTRFLEISIFGQKLSLLISALKNPLRAAFHPLWLLLILLSLACAMFGGFRSGLAAVLLTYMVGTYYRGGFMAVLLCSLGGAMALSLLAFVNLVAPLPPNVQRTLTFLPGTWEERYKRDAEGSTDWRVEIWKEVLLTDRWIHNKIIGDGLGFTRQQLEYQLRLNDKTMHSIGLSGYDMHREGVLASGDYHSGPVSTIRVIGYVGLAFLILFQVRLAVHAHRQIIRCRGTEWYPLSLLIGIPLIWGPVFFHFIFGDFRNEVVTLLMGAAMIRILERGLPLPAYQMRRHPQPISLPPGTIARS